MTAKSGKIYIVDMLSFTKITWITKFSTLSGIRFFYEDEAFYDLVPNNEEKRPVGLMLFREMASPLRGKNVGFLDDLFVVPRSHVEQE